MADQGEGGQQQGEQQQEFKLSVTVLYNPDNGSTQVSVNPDKAMARPDIVRAALQQADAMVLNVLLQRLAVGTQSHIAVADELGLKRALKLSGLDN